MDAGVNYSASFIWNKRGGTFMSWESYKNNELFVDEVMRECWKHKEELAAEFPTWEALYDHLHENRPRLEAEGWKFISPADLPRPQKQEVRDNPSH